MLTPEKLNNIHKLNPDEVRQIFLECVEYWGLEDMDTAEKLLGISKRRIYQKMNENNSISIGRHKLPCINLMLK
jgi:hypothetical protein